MEMWDRRRLPDKQKDALVLAAGAVAGKILAAEMPSTSDLEAKHAQKLKFVGDQLGQIERVVYEYLPAIIGVRNERGPFFRMGSDGYIKFIADGVEVEADQAAFEKGIELFMDQFLRLKGVGQ